MEVVVVVARRPLLVGHERLGPREGVVRRADRLRVGDREAFVCGKGWWEVGGGGRSAGAPVGVRRGRSACGRAASKRAQQTRPNSSSTPAQAMHRRAPLSSGGNSAVNSLNALSSGPRSMRSAAFRSTARIACVAHALLMTCLRWRVALLIGIVGVRCVLCVVCFCSVVFGEVRER